VVALCQAFTGACSTAVAIRAGACRLITSREIVEGGGEIVLVGIEGGVERLSATRRNIAQTVRTHVYAGKLSTPIPPDALSVGANPPFGWTPFGAARGPSNGGEIIRLIGDCVVAPGPQRPHRGGGRRGGWVGRGGWVAARDAFHIPNPTEGKGVKEVWIPRGSTIKD